MPVLTSSESSGGPLGNLLMTTGLSSTVPPTLSVSWVESVCPAMGGNQTGKDSTEVGKDTKVTKDLTQLLADTRKAGQDAVDAVLDLIPEVKHELPPVYPRIDVASVLTISCHYTEEALKNVHTQISDLIQTHVAGPKQAGVFFNTILPITCSFRHQMDEMAINLLFPGSQLVPNVWGARREVLEGLSLVAPPSCSASWPASLVEWVAPVPGTSGQSGSAKTPTKPCNPRAGKLTPGSGKKTQPIQQAAGMFWGDKKKREKEDADAQAQERSVRRDPLGLFSPWMNTSILSLSSPTGPLPVGPHSHLAKLNLPPQKTG